MANIKLAFLVSRRIYSLLVKGSFPFLCALTLETTSSQQHATQVSGWVDARGDLLAFILLCCGCMDYVEENLIYIDGHPFHYYQL